MVVYDARGRTAPGTARRYPAMADDVAALAERLELGPFFHAGHSMGGRVALEHGLAHAGEVRAITTLSARAEETDERGRARPEALIEEVRREGGGAAAIGSSRTTRDTTASRRSAPPNHFEGHSGADRVRPRRRRVARRAAARARRPRARDRPRARRRLRPVDADDGGGRAAGAGRLRQQSATSRTSRRPSSSPSC